MTSKDAGVLINILGFITGATLYAMLLVMVVRTLRVTQASSSEVTDERLTSSVDLLPLVTAILGLTWNVGALSTFGMRDLGVAEPVPVLIAAAFSALGFLPAVVVHSALRGGEAISKRKGALRIMILAYSISATASALHLYSAAVERAAPSRPALLLLTLSFGTLMIPLLALTRRQPGRSRVWWVIALSVFAVSALHLSHHEGTQYSWSVELAGHHASLPLAVAILYQDYRFALADIFLKRALTLVALVAIAFGLYITVAPPLLSGGNGSPRSEPIAVGALLGMWVATALIYPVLRKAVARFVDKVVLSRTDYDELRAEITRLATMHEETSVILDKTCARVGRALTARNVTWIELGDEVNVGGSSAAIVDEMMSRFQPGGSPLEDGHGLAEEDRIVLPGPRDFGATVIIPTTEPPRYALFINELSAGRRLLSDDTAMLGAVAFVIARRIDALRITHERCEQNLREQEISKLATEAELRALRAQINPHFLFNALTTIGYLIQSAPDRALETLMRLTDLLRGVLRSGGEFVTLGEEIKLIESYLDIERARFEERLRSSIEIPASLLSSRIPPLILQPLVENAIKHGIAPCKYGGEVTVSASVEGCQNESSQPAQLLCITVRDTGVGVSEIELAHGRKRGLGISNVEQRLKCYYGSEASLTIKSARGAGTTVEARLPVAMKSVNDQTISLSSNHRRQA